MCNIIKVDISTTRHPGHGVRVRRSGENDPGKLLDSSFIRKDGKNITHRWRSNYDAGQKIRAGTPESSDVIKEEIPKLLAKERRTE